MFRDKEPLGSRKPKGWNTLFIDRQNGAVIDRRFWIVRTSQVTSETTVVRVFDIQEGTFSKHIHLDLNTLYNLAPEAPDVNIALTRYGNAKTTKIHIEAPQTVALHKEINYIEEYKNDVFN